MKKNSKQVALVVIDAELGRKNHGSIPHNCDQEGLKPLDARTPKPE
jgi:hypothetical protein